MVSGFVIVQVPLYSQYMVCPNCGAQVPSFSNFCNMCGKPLRQPPVLKICPRCQNRMPESAKFCPECGLRQKASK